MNDKQFKHMIKKLNDGFHDVVLALDDIKTEIQRYRAMMYHIYKKEGKIQEGDVHE